MNGVLADVGERFANARSLAGLTQQHVADAVGLSRASIGNFEAGRQDTPISTVIAMCAAVGVPLGHLTSSESLVEQTGAMRLRTRHMQARMDALHAEVVDQYRTIERLAKIVDQRNAG